MGYIPKHAQLEALSDEDLIARYDAAAANTVVGTGFYREEIARRQMARESTRMLELTRTIRTLTWVILGLTAVNAALVAVQVWAA
ncbi:hypothetical protein [Cognatiluteimonas weifangensis]|uniref:hypothetical protein n=1 Tax=Cognatiluteimonas weifangensis TaxID=2303539 RepID=UPI0011C15E27|nr:hypothetical protein [Luteimonas weifangensis]